MWIDTFSRRLDCYIFTMMAPAQNKNFRSWLLIPSILVIFSGMTGCPSSNVEANKPELPKHNLWAWERPEDLRWLEGKNDIGVAFLAQTIFIKNNRIEIRSRKQPLRVRPETFLTAVTRIETDRSPGHTIDLTDAEFNKIRQTIISNLTLKGVRSIQIDFDAVKSERGFYKRLLESIKPSLPRNTAFSITALASWCTGDLWMSGLPVDEAIPMVFDMGTDEQVIRDFLASGKDWPEPLCRSSYGLAVYQPVAADLNHTRHFYHFSRSPWRESDLKNIIEEN